jgi:hypothetical protein
MSGRELYNWTVKVEDLQTVFRKRVEDLQPFDFFLHFVYIQTIQSVLTY